VTQTLGAATLEAAAEMPPVTISPTTVTLSPASLFASAAVGFSRLIPPATTDIEAEVYEQNAFDLTGGTAVLVDTLADSLNREWQDMLSEAGSGSFKIPNDDVSAPSPTFGRLVAFKYRGVYAWTMLCEKRHKIDVDPQEAVAELTEWSGRGHLALLEEALVYPTNGVGVVPIEDDRVFNWTSANYDDSAWGNATEILLMFYAPATWAGLTQSPLAAQDFVDDTAWVLWGQPGTYITAPPGFVFFRQTFTVPNDGSFIITVIMDDWGPWYLDGVKQADQMSNFIKAQQYQVQLSAGTHLIAARVINFFAADPAHNPGGFAFSVADNQNGTPGTVHANSDATCKTLSYVDEPPGMTPGQVIDILYNEAVARGCFTNGLSFYFPFGLLADSQGAPWPVVADIATRVGTDMLTFMRELSATYVDFWMEPTSLRIWAVNIGTRGVDSGIDLHSPSDVTNPASGNLTRLEFEDTL